MAESSTPYVLLGTIVKPHGYQGSFLVRTDTGQESALSYLPVLFLKKGNAFQSFRVQEAAWMPKGWKISLEGISTQSQSEALREQGIYAERSSLRSLQPNEYYVDDLMGAEVLDERGTPLGRLSAVDEARGRNEIGHAIWRIRLKSGEMVDVPATQKFIVSVDAQKKQVIVINLDTLGVER